MDYKKFISPKLLLFIFVALNLIIGFFIIPDYGIITDENPEMTRSKASLSMFLFSEENNPINSYAEMGHVRYYGTAVTTTIRFIEKVFFPNFRSFKISSCALLLFGNISNFNHWDIQIFYFFLR